MMYRSQIRGNSLKGLLVALFLSQFSHYLATQENQNETLIANTAPNPNQSPGDYSYSPVGSRVKDLVGFFEVLDKSHEDRDLSKKQNLVLSLSESASKLHILADGLPLDLKCSKYYRLISKPNIRTIATISLLMKEVRQFSETRQEDANLQSRIASDRHFDALGRIQTILQTLEAERTLGKSELESVVQKDLLDCISYYIYRHQRAVDQVVQVVRDTSNSLTASMIESSASEIQIKALRESLDKIIEVELREKTTNQTYHNEWLNSLVQLQSQVVQRDYEIPDYIIQFLKESNRIDRLNEIYDAQNRCSLLMNKLLANEDLPTAESSSDFMELNSLFEEFRDVLAEDIEQFVNESKRRKLLAVGTATDESPELIEEIARSEAESFDVPPSEASLTQSSSSLEQQPLDDANSTDLTDSNAVNEQVEQPDRHEQPERGLVELDVLGKQNPVVSDGERLDLIDTDWLSSSTEQETDSTEADAIYSDGFNLGLAADDILDSSASPVESLMMICSQLIKDEVTHIAAEAHRWILTQTLHELNTECFSSSYQLWLENNFLIENNSNGALNQQLRLDLEGVCREVLAQKPTSLSRDDCKKFADSLKLLGASK